jgi:hypothetical protein
MLLIGMAAILTSGRRIVSKLVDARDASTTDPVFDRRFLALEISTVKRECAAFETNLA